MNRLHNYCTKNALSISARVLVSSASPELRRNEGPKIFEFYYEKLRENMPERKVPFSLDDIHRAYKKILPYSFGFYIFGVPLMSSSPIVEGPDKEQKVENLMFRGKCIMDDVIELYSKKE